MLPNSRVPTAEARAKAHTIVVAEVKGGATTGAGAVSLGWCDLKVASTIKGKAKSVDGKRIGYTAYGGGMPPTVGQSYLFFIGKDHDLDAILKVMPASEATVRGLTNAEVGLRAVHAGVACRMQGDDLTIAAAGAKSHTIIVAEVQGWVEIGAGGYSMAWSGFKVESALKGELLPGDLKGFGWRPSDGESSPRVGESLLVFVGNSGQNFDTVSKFLPATAANIQEARDQIIAAGPPVAARPATAPGDGPAQAVSASRSPTRPE